MNDQYIVVLITTPGLEAAEKVARELLGKKLAACVNILPSVQSIFTWQGKTQDDREVLLLVKTRLSLFQDQLVPAVQSVHPYEVPEIIALPILAGSQNYLDWIAAETSA